MCLSVNRKGDFSLFILVSEMRIVHASRFDIDVFGYMDVMQATDEEIRQAFRRRARETHPDRHLDDPLATPRFQSLQHAYEILKDPVLRNEYDRALLHTLALEVGYERGNMGGYIDSGVNGM